MMELTAKNITVRRGGRTILDRLSVCLRSDQITAIIGPNGSGKSTLLHALAGLLPLGDGLVFLDGRRIDRIARRLLAKDLAILSQHPEAPEGLNLREVVAHARFAHHRLWEPLSDQDRKIVQEALERTRILDLADRPFSQLSGGERQRGWIALTLAQAPRMLLLDEPTSHLDVGHQTQVLALLKQLRQTAGPGLVIVLHDINHAGLLADRILAMKEGKIITDGVPKDVIHPDMMRQLFDAQVDVFETRDGRPYCIPAGLFNGVDPGFCPSKDVSAI
ncbi:MAG: ABC transporter ATP-binding protein [Pseudomonadota bacterium]